MAIDVQIINSDDGSLAHVTPNRSLKVTNSTFPPIESNGKVRIFRQNFTEGGEPDGLADMRVNDNERQFIIKADKNNERFIKTISFFIADNVATLNEFGNIGVLTNGVKFFYVDSVGEVIIHPALKTNFDFIRLCLGQPAFGSGNSNFKVTNAIGTSEGFMPTLDFTNLGFPWGLHLESGTNQKLIIEINDDITSVDVFDAIAYGFDRIPD